MCMKFTTGQQLYTMTTSIALPLLMYSLHSVSQLVCVKFTECNGVVTCKTVLLRIYIHISSITFCMTNSKAFSNPVTKTNYVDFYFALQIWVVVVDSSEVLVFHRTWFINNLVCGRIPRMIRSGSGMRAFISCNNVTDNATSSRTLNSQR